MIKDNFFHPSMKDVEFVGVPPHGSMPLKFRAQVGQTGTEQMGHSNRNKLAGTSGAQ